MWKLWQSYDDFGGASKNGLTGGTVLSLAASKGNTEIAKLLLDAGADLNAKTDVSEFTALMNAAQAGETETAKLLLHAGWVAYEASLKSCSSCWMQALM
jgi:ankyrin repeat protein